MFSTHDTHPFTPYTLVRELIVNPQLAVNPAKAALGAKGFLTLYMWCMLSDIH